MAHGVAAVWMPVTDMDRAVHFYSDLLGFPVTKRGDDWSEVDANGLRLGLNAREEVSPRVAEGGAVVTFQPDGELEDERDRLTQAGVTFIDGIAEHPWGRLATFKDSEGNDLQLFGHPR